LLCEPLALGELPVGKDGFSARKSLKTRWKVSDVKPNASLRASEFSSLPDETLVSRGILHATGHFLSALLRHIGTKIVTAFSLWADMHTPA
jgi:hypothetical protein